MKSLPYPILLCICFCMHVFIPTLLIGFDQSRFFHAQYFPQEPRFEEALLTSAMLRSFTGITCVKTDCCGAAVQSDDYRHYRVQSVILDLAQNFYRGFYVSLTAPWYSFKVYENGNEHKFNTWANIYLMTGWTCNYEGCSDLDFIDFTFETGCILPTGNHRLYATGMPFRATLATGLYDWITMGLSADIIAFFDDLNGRLWDITWYLKADHLFHGLSFLFGYTHSNQTKTPVPWLPVCLPCWNMDTFHFECSYDSACLQYPYLPCLYFFYNHVLSGKNILRTPQWGIGISCDF